MGDVPWGKVGAGALHYNADGRQVEILINLSELLKLSRHHHLQRDLAPPRSIAFTEVVAPEQKVKRHAPAVPGVESTFVVSPTTLRLFRACSSTGGGALTRNVKYGMKLNFLFRRSLPSVGLSLSLSRRECRTRDRSMFPSPNFLYFPEN